MKKILCMVMAICLSFLAMSCNGCKKQDDSSGGGNTDNGETIINKTDIKNSRQSENRL